MHGKMMCRFYVSLLKWVVISLFCSCGLAKPEQGFQVHTLFSHNAVLQESEATRIWGWGTAGEAVRVSLGDRQAETVVDEQGRWQVELNLTGVGSEPQVLVVEGEKRIEIKNVLVGEVWLASGQSNMQQRLQAMTGAEQEIAKADIPEFREFRIPVTQAPVPQEHLKGSWVVTTPQRAGGHGAVAYFFGKILHRELGRPVGIIQCSWSNTPLEPWISDEALATDPILKEDAERLQAYFAEQEKRDPADHKVQARHVPTRIYNGMIAPLRLSTIRGFLWYQGESNAARAAYYRVAFPLMIRDWREKWGQGDLPFYFCQLASYRKPVDVPGNSTWAELRESQEKALALPNTGRVVLIDAGEEADIHPRNKWLVGERLAAIVLAETYGLDVPFESPVFDSYQVEGSQIRIHFRHAGGGLMAKPLPEQYQPKSVDPRTVPLVRNSPDSELEGFAICGEDGQFHWADARIEGSSVVVSSPEVPKPVAVRYAWSDHPLVNLYNAEGFPAASFRTDDFRLYTEGKRYRPPAK